MERAKFAFISVIIVSLFLTFQNCSGPKSIAYQEDQANSSLSVPNIFEVNEGESLALVAPINQMLGQNKSVNTSQLSIQWFYVSPNGQRELLSLQGSEVQLANLLPEDSGTYQVQVVENETLYSFDFLVRVYAIQNVEATYLGTFTMRYQNNLCQSHLDEGLTRVDGVSYQEANTLCARAQHDSGIRQNRAILCSFNSINFSSIPSTEPRRDFIAQKQANGVGAFQDAYIFRAVGRCSATVKCRDYIQGQIAQGQIIGESQVHCYWGREERIYAFGSTAPVIPPPTTTIPGGRDPGGGR